MSVIWRLELETQSLDFGVKTQSEKVINILPPLSLCWDWENCERISLLAGKKVKNRKPAPHVFNSKILEMNCFSIILRVSYERFSFLSFNGIHFGVFFLRLTAFYFSLGLDMMHPDLSTGP